MNKTALITGASKGIGKAIAKKLAEDGYNIIINYYKSEAEAKKLAASLDNAVAIKADVSKNEEVKKMVQTAKEIFGDIDVLINNAGIASQKLFFDITEEEWDNIINVNLKSVFNTCKEILPSMVNKKYGKIVNISSIWGMTGASCEVHYSAAKAAIIGFTKALAKEVGPSNVNVNCVAPGVITTDMNSNLDKETLTQLKEETPLMRIGTAEDIANAVSFLVSENASFITGQVLSPNGGIVI